jgi:hypothetical protein
MIADSTAIGRFQTILDLITANGLRVVTFRELQAMADGKNRYLHGPDPVPEISVQIGIIEYMRKAIGLRRDNYTWHFAFIVISLMLFGILTTILWKRVSGKRFHKQ